MLSSLPRTAYLFIHHNQIESIQLTVSDFIKVSDANSLFVLVDNSEDDYLQKRLKEILAKEHWPVELLIIQNNGYGHAANFGLEYIQVNYPHIDHVVIITHDVRYISGEISILTQALDSNRKMVLIGPRVINSNFFSSDEPRIWSDGGRLTPILKRPIHLNFGKVVNTRTDSNYVTWLDGCFMAIDLRKLQKVQFDIEYFMYLEDVDFCIQLGRAGLKIGHTPLFAVSQESLGVPPRVFSKNYLRFIEKFFPSRLLLARLALLVRGLWQQK